MIKIHHLVRYALAVGLLAFLAYANHVVPQVMLVLVGPAIYLAYALKTFVVSQVWSAVPSSDTVNKYFFLLPSTLVYYGVAAYQFKQLWNERRGALAIAGLVGLSAFILYVHYLSWTNLNLYLHPARLI